MSIIKPLTLDIKQIYSIADYFIININATTLYDICEVEPTALKIFEVYPAWLPNVSKTFAGQCVEHGNYKCYYPFGLRFSKGKVILMQVKDWHYNTFENKIFSWSLNWLIKFANDNSNQRFDCFISSDLVAYYKQLPNNVYVHIIN